MPGKFLQAMKTAGAANPVLMLDEMKLIMRSSFIVEKMGRLGMPKAMQKILEQAEPGKCPVHA